MARFTQRWPWKTQPQRPVDIDKGNPLARGLVLANTLGATRAYDAAARLPTTITGTKLTAGRPGVVSAFGSGVGVATTDVVNSNFGAHTTQWSIAIWVYRISNGFDGGANNVCMFADKRPDNTTGTSFMNRGDVTSYDILVGWSTPGFATWRYSRPPILEWHRELVTYDGSSTANAPVVYRDGVDLGAPTTITAAAGTLTVNTSSWRFGNRLDGLRCVDGYMAEPRVWNRILTPAEARADFLNSRPVYASLPRRIWAAASGADFTHVATGGLIFGGAATASQTADYAASAAGGLVFGGAAAAEAADYSFAASGGIVFAGAAAASQTADYSFSSAGGILFAGAALTSQTADYASTASGGLLFAGAAGTTYTADFSQIGSGGLVFGGAAGAEASADYVATASGGLLFAGAAAATYTADFAWVASGGILFGGAAGASSGSGFEFIATGGLNFGGAAAAAATADWSMTASGGLTFGGAASASQTADYAASGAGGLTFGGAAAVSQTAAYSMTAAGGLLFGGAAAAQAGGFEIIASGGIVFGGAAGALLTPVTAAIYARIPGDAVPADRMSRPAAIQHGTRPDQLSARRRRN